MTSDEWSGVMACCLQTWRTYFIFNSGPRFEIISNNLSYEQEAKLREAFAE
jgi:hypothetical protein